MIFILITLFFFTISKNIVVHHCIQLKIYPYRAQTHIEYKKLVGSSEDL
jgi:hypothetical protein